MPAGPDPFAEDRERIRAAARAGEPCPVNQHGCMYFSASEWRFCRMCEWQMGHGPAEHEGLLAPLGGTVASHAEELAAGRTLHITKAGLNALFKAPGTKSFNGALQEWHWKKLGPQAQGDAEDKVFITRTQLHNLLMEYGAPNECLTDQLWLDLQASWPPAAAAEQG